MYLQSGEPGIISMIKRFFRRFKNLKLITFLTDILAFGLACVIIIFAAVSLERTELTDKKINDVKQYSEELARRIYSNAYLANSSENTGITREMSIMANKYDGRILVIDSTLKCISDTFNIETDKTFISTEVIQALKNNYSEYTDYENAKVEMYYPIDFDENDADTALNGVILFSFSIKNELDNTERLWKSLLLIAIPCFVFVFIIAVFHSRYVTKPIKKITYSLNHISAGYLEDNIEIKSFTEFEEMTEAFNNMVMRLNSIENSRQEFVSNVSHELKTPLTSIKILADSLVMQPDAAPEVYREFLGDINSEIDRENRIISDLLELVKLDRKNGEMHIAMVSMNELLEILMKRIKPIAQARNVELIYESYRKVDAEVDEVKMMLAISNLVENAVKYNKDAGRVKVTLDSDHKFFTVIVADTGIGIPESSIGLIFDRFYRVDKMRARKTGGTGLGLSITRSVILMHNGNIKVESTEGEGTTFTVRVPLSFVEKNTEG
ncbi:MAG: HAMP domain-containing protein [Lachnospiraceae bacterium]|nr:HAMP domain-containing protein [Lachnospiraceae bacterium]